MRSLRRLPVELRDRLAGKSDSTKTRGVGIISAGSNMPLSLKELLNRIRQNLGDHAYPNERSVVSRVVMVLLETETLAWDIHNPRQVIEEFSPIPNQIGKKVDLALCAIPQARKADVYIEVKAHGVLKRQEAISEAEAQLGEYESYYRVTLAVLTDGEIWRFYYPLVDGTYADRLALSLNLLNDSLASIEEYFPKLMGFQAVSRGEVAPLIRDLHQKRHEVEQIKADFPAVLRKLLAEPTEGLVQEIVQAYVRDLHVTPDGDTIRQLLKSSESDQWQSQDPSFEEDKEQEVSEEEPLGGGMRAGRSRIRITLSWIAMGQNNPTKVICERKASDSLRVFMESVAGILGREILEKISTFRVHRGPFVTKTPKVHYRYSNNRFFQSQPIANTGFYVLTHSQSSQKVADLENLSRFLRWPAGFLNVEQVMD
jgi:hypothetical protein